MADPFPEILRPSMLRARITSNDTLLEWNDAYSLRFDLEGRWHSFRDHEFFYRKTLEGSAVWGWHSKKAPQPVKNLGTLHGQIQDTVKQLLHTLQEQPQVAIFTGSLGNPILLRERLERILNWSLEQLYAEMEKYRNAYPEPVCILPPDCYRDLVLVPAVGCPHAACSFCAFYLNKKFRVLSQHEFQTHLQAVQKLLGSRMTSRRGIFLGSANALALSNSQLIPILQQGQSLPTQTQKIRAFWDPDHAPKRLQTDWQALQEKGLEQIYVGLETGVPELRQSLGKQGSPQSIAHKVLTQKAGGLATGIILLSGVGGMKAVESHARKSIKVLLDMNLDKKDIVFVSPLKDSLPDLELKKITRDLIQQLREHLSCKIAPYEIQRFQYFT